MQNSLQHSRSDHRKVFACRWPGVWLLYVNLLQPWSGPYACDPETLCSGREEVGGGAPLCTDAFRGCIWHPSFCRLPIHSSPRKVKREKWRIWVFRNVVISTHLAPISESVICPRTSTHKMTDHGSLSPNPSFQNYECCANVLPEMAPAFNRFSSFRSSKREDKFCLIQSLLNLSVSTNIDGVNPENGSKARRHF